MSCPFDKRCMFLIHYRLKTETRRLYNPARRPAVPGGKIWLKIDRTPKRYGQLEILSCEPQRFGDMTQEDAHNEGFRNLAEYKKYFYKVNGQISDDDLVWVVKFKPIWTDTKGIIMAK